MTEETFSVCKGVTITEEKGKVYLGGAVFKLISGGREVQLFGYVPGFGGATVDGTIRFSCEALIKLAIRIVSSSLVKRIAPHQYVPIRAIKSSKERQGEDTRRMREEVKAFEGRYGPPRPEAQRNLLSTSQGIVRGAVSLKKDRDPPEFVFSHNRFSIEMLIEFAAMILSDVAIQEEDDRYYVPFFVVREPNAWKGTALAHGQPALSPVKASPLRPTVVQVGAPDPSTAGLMIEGLLRKFSPSVLLHLAVLMRAQLTDPEAQLGTRRYGGVCEGFRAFLPVLEDALKKEGVAPDLSPLFEELSRADRARIEEEWSKVRDARQELSNDLARLLEEKIEELELREQLLDEEQTRKSEELTAHAESLKRERADINALFDEAAQKDAAATRKMEELGVRMLELEQRERLVSTQLRRIGEDAAGISPTASASPAPTRNGTHHRDPPAPSEEETEFTDLDGSEKTMKIGAAKEITRAYKIVHEGGFSSKAMRNAEAYLHRARQLFSCKTDSELLTQARTVISRDGLKTWRPALKGSSAS